MSWSQLKPVGETIYDELVGIMSPIEARKVIEILHSRVVEHQCGDLAMIADRLFRELIGTRQKPGEFNLGAVAIILDAARRKARRMKYEEGGKCK